MYYRRKITFSGYDKDGTLTNFPALVVFTNEVGSDSIYSGFLSTNGYDLRFWNSNLTQELNY